MEPTKIRNVTYDFSLWLNVYDLYRFLDEMPYAFKYPSMVLEIKTRMEYDEYDESETEEYISVKYILEYYKDETRLSPKNKELKAYLLKTHNVG